MEDYTEFRRMVRRVVNNPEKYLRKLKAKQAAGGILIERESTQLAIAEVALHSAKYVRMRDEGIEKLTGIVKAIGENIDAGLPMNEEERHALRRISDATADLATREYKSEEERHALRSIRDAAYDLLTRE